ncbi:MAG: DUF2268 domain-containing putative Zn-dependent protease, partial [Candidatus Dormiibacterota bacterium]
TGPVVMRRSGALLVLASLALAGCANVSPRVPVRVQAANGRFVVSLTREVLNEAAGRNVDLRQLTREDLARIDSLLPGPATTITVTVGDPDQILASIGAVGFTDPETGAITVGLYPSWSDEPADVSQELARTLAREVDRSVRITSGAGLGKTILDELVADGAATAFDQFAFPGPPDPWVGALTAKQECQQWGHIEPLLATVGIHQEVLTGGSVSAATFGESSMPPLTGRAIGYHIVADYLARQGKTSWSALAATSTRAIFQASGYAPCPAS